jgi:hypothetical protein
MYFLVMEGNDELECFPHMTRGKDGHNSLFSMQMENKHKQVANQPTNQL